MTHTQSDRLLALPPYIFSEINLLKAEAVKRGQSLLSLAIGDPDLPTPSAIIEKIREASLDPETHLYSPYEGTLSFRTAVADWFQTRFGVKLNPEREVLALIGSKEGIAHFPQAFCNSGDKCLYPSPGYPIFATAIQLAGGIPIPVPLRPENDFVPDVAELKKLITEHKPKYLLINFPSNPTTATCPLSTLEEIVGLCRANGTILVSDNAYSEVYFGTENKPHSLLEVEGAKDIAIEFHSLSKTFSMTGWRIGFAVGNPELIAGLLRLKTNIDSGPLLAIQKASEFALRNAESLCQPLRSIYAERRKIALAGLSKAGIEYFDPKATFFVWAKVPGSKGSMDFTKQMIQKNSLVVTPGVGFGPEGESFFRLALTVPEALIRQAIERLSK